MQSTFCITVYSSYYTVLIKTYLYTIANAAILLASSTCMEMYCILIKYTCIYIRIKTVPENKILPVVQFFSEIVKKRTFILKDKSYN